jgi:hypothetical protein
MLFPARLGVVMNCASLSYALSLIKLLPGLPNVVRFCPSFDPILGADLTALRLKGNPSFEVSRSSAVVLDSREKRRRRR